MNANDDDSKQMEEPEEQFEPQLPNPPEPRKSMEIRAPDTNMPDPPAPTLSWEEVPDSDNA